MTHGGSTSGILFPNSWVLMETTVLFHSPQQLIQPSSFHAFSATLLPLVFRYLCLLPYWESWDLQEWRCQDSIPHLYIPCSPPSTWSEDIRSLSFLVKVIHSYFPRLHSTHCTHFIFFFSPVFSSLSYTQGKKCAHPAETSPEVCVSPWVSHPFTPLPSQLSWP